MIEYAVLDLKKDRKKLVDLEGYLNKIARRGWRVKCAVGNKIILVKLVSKKKR